MENRPTLTQREIEDIYVGRLFSSLTPREREVVPWVLKGLTNNQIADLLNIQPATVKIHVRNILSKINNDGSKVTRKDAIKQFEKLGADAVSGLPTTKVPEKSESRAIATLPQRSELTPESPPEFQGAIGKAVERSKTLANEQAPEVESRTHQKLYPKKSTGENPKTIDGQVQVDQGVQIDNLKTMGGIRPNISPSAALRSQWWLQTPGGDNVDAPQLWCFSLGGDGKLNRTQMEDAPQDGVLRKTEATSGSVTLSPDGSLIAFLVGGRLQFRVVDTRKGLTYELPYQLDSRDISQNARVLAATRRGSRELILAVQNGSGTMLLRISKEGTTSLPFVNSGFETMSAAFLGQDLLYVLSSVSGEGQNSSRHLLRQLRKVGDNAEDAYCSIIAPPTSFTDWNTVPVFAVDVVMVSGKPLIALLVARSGNRIECQTDQKSLLIASAGHKPGEWTWKQHEVEATACTMNIVRDPYGKGNSVRMHLGTEQGSDIMYFVRTEE